MPEAFYQDRVYPLQNQMLSLVQGAGVEFYLTGGTALSRYFLNHLKPKNTIDLLFFAKRYPFSWEEVLEEAKEKDL